MHKIICMAFFIAVSSAQAKDNCPIHGNPDYGATPAEVLACEDPATPDFAGIATCGGGWSDDGILVRRAMCFYQRYDHISRHQKAYRIFKRAKQNSQKWSYFKVMVTDWNEEPDFSRLDAYPQP